MPRRECNFCMLFELDVLLLLERGCTLIPTEMACTGQRAPWPAMYILEK